jgi:NAD(P)H-dependent FMN reductase
VGPQITEFVHSTISDHLSSQNTSPTNITLEVVDIATFNLPLFNEPGIPQGIKDPSKYVYEHTRTWSRKVASYNAYVFVTPQYNWGIPAALKNAIDYLFNEWTGKPGMVVSYGGHGGGRAAEALRIVLLGLKMKTPETTVNLGFPGKEFRDKCFAGEELGLDGENGKGTWEKEKEEIWGVWEEMIKLLEV